MGNSEVIGMIVIALGSILSVGVIIVKPMLQTVKIMTELNESIKTLTEKFNKFEVNNHDDHKRIWNHNEEQDEKLQDHEKRIWVIEHGN